MKHLIKIESTPHGALGVRHAGLDQQYCEAGEQVILKWQPDAKWGLQEAHYTDGDGNIVPIDLGNGNGVVSFMMPDKNITINGTFKMFVSQDWTEGTNPSKGKVLTVGNNGEPAPISVDELANQITEGDNDLVDAIDRINPFKGWYTDLASLQNNHPSPQVGDYAYVKGAESTDPAAIYECTTAGTWSDSGRTADTSNVQTFASNQEVNEVHIVNDLNTGGVDDVLSAEQGKSLNSKINSLSDEVDVLDPMTDGGWKIPGYRIGWSNGTSSSSSDYTVRFFKNKGYKKVVAIVTSTATTHASVAFYSTDEISSDGYMQAYSVQSENSIDRRIVVSVPSGCKSIAITNKDAALPNPTIMVSNAIYVLENTQENDRRLTYKYFADFSNEEIFTIQDTSLVKATGYTQSTTGMICSDFIKVYKGDSFDYCLMVSNTAIGLLCVYDNKKVFISCDVYHTAGQSNAKQGVWTATHDGYIRVCTLSGNSYIRYAYVHYHRIKNTIPQTIEKLQDALPDYWETYLTSKNTDINLALKELGTHGDSLIFFTDYHILQNTGFTPTIIRRLQKKYKINQVVHCGDIMNTEDNDAALMNQFENYIQAFHNVNVLNVIGNHDYNPFSSDGTTTFDTIYPILQKNIEHDYQCGGNSLDGYFYRDNAQQKIRYIYLNTRTNGIAATDTVQLDWFKSVLNTVSDGWYVVVIAHLVFEWYTNQQDEKYTSLATSGLIIKDICDGFQNKTSGTGHGVSWDFTNAHGNIACVLCGHTHIDVSEQSSAGYYIIGFDRDAIDYPPVAQASERTKGTYSEQSLDIICIDTLNKQVKCVRIGGGSDRTFSFS